MCCVCFLLRVLAGAGKTASLEGGKAKDSIKNSDQGDGLVHLAIDELFRLINQKAAAVGACCCIALATECFCTQLG